MKTRMSFSWYAWLYRMRFVERYDVYKRMDWRVGQVRQVLVYAQLELRQHGSLLIGNNILTVGGDVKVLHHHGSVFPKTKLKTNAMSCTIIYTSQGVLKYVNLILARCCLYTLICFSPNP